MIRECLAHWQHQDHHSAGVTAARAASETATADPEALSMAAECTEVSPLNLKVDLDRLRVETARKGV